MQFFRELCESNLILALIYNQVAEEIRQKEEAERRQAEWKRIQEEKIRKEEWERDRPRREAEEKARRREAEEKALHEKRERIVGITVIVIMIFFGFFCCWYDSKVRAENKAKAAAEEAQRRSVADAERKALEESRQKAAAEEAQRRSDLIAKQIRVKICEQECERIQIQIDQNRALIRQAEGYGGENSFSDFFRNNYKSAMANIKMLSNNLALARKDWSEANRAMNDAKNKTR